MNSVMSRAGQAINLKGEALSPARTSPSTSAMKKPTTVACNVTTRPFIKIGSIDRAKAQCLDVSHAMPSSMSGPPCAPAPDGTFQQHHKRRKDQGHAKIHK